MVEERGVVVALNGGKAQVRAVGRDHCSGCAASGACQIVSSGERLVEADNDAGATLGEEVIMSVPSRDLLAASFQVYVMPVLGVLAGAAAAQAAVHAVAGPEAASSAAAAGGVAGAVLAVAATRFYRKSRREGGALRPRITRVVVNGKTQTLS